MVEQMGLDGNCAFGYPFTHMDQIPQPVSDTVRNGRPWWQMCCTGCLIFLLAAIIGGFILLQTIAGPGVVHPHSLPSNYPGDIVPLRIEEARSISYLQGKSKSKIRDTLYAPIIFFTKLIGQGTASGTEMASAEQAFNSEGASVENTDTVTVDWKNFSGTPIGVLGYYNSLFQKAGLTTEQTHDDSTNSDTLTGLRQGTFAEVDLTEGSNTSTIDALVLSVTYSNQK